MAEHSVEFRIDFTYLHEKKKALHDAEGEIQKGQCICLCGESGCGKSTLLRCINHLIPEFYEGELTGFIRLAGEEIQELSIADVSTKAASVFQDPRSQFFTVNSTTEVAFGLENAGVSHQEIVKRTEETFRRFGLEKLRDRSVFSLSSGERQLVAILSAVAMDTDVILLDEPTANLDAAAIAQLAALLSEIKKTGKTLIINEHRLYFLDGLADAYWYIRDGCPEQKYTAEEFRQLLPAQLDALGLRCTDLKALTASAPTPTVTAQKDVFEVRALQYRYSVGNCILSDVSCRSETGHVTAVIGSNGSGKTTFGKCISGLLKSDQGEFYLNGQRISQKELTSHAMFIMQEAEFQFFSNTVMNEICYGHDRDAPFLEEAEQKLRELHLWECRDRHPFSLSGGQMQKLTLLLAYFSDKPLLVLDEPTAGLDHRSMKACVRLIREMQQRKIIFIITHDLELISQACTDSITIREGGIAERFELSRSEEFQRLSDYMFRVFRVSDNERTPERKHSRHLADPRVYLLYLAAAAGFCFTGNTAIMAAIMTGLLLVSAVSRQFRQILIYVPLFVLLLMTPHLTDVLFLNIAANFFLRFIPVGFAADLLFTGDGSSRILAGLRKMHCPERAIMVCAVIFRFFPVLGNDMRISMQSVRTRSFFPKWTDKLRSIPAYAEILIVPMMFRVIRIAEFLAASAEARGISRKVRKYSYVDCRIRVSDVVLMLFLPLLIAAYQLLPVSV